MYSGKRNDPEVFLFPKIPHYPSSTSLQYSLPSVMTASAPNHIQGYSEGYGRLNRELGQGGYPNYNYNGYQESISMGDSPQIPRFSSNAGYEYQYTPEKFDYWNRALSLASLVSPPHLNINHNKYAYISKHDIENDNIFNHKLDRLKSKQDEILRKIMSRNFGLESKVQEYVDKYKNEGLNAKAKKNYSPSEHPIKDYNQNPLSRQNSNESYPNSTNFESDPQSLSLSNRSHRTNYSHSNKKGGSHQKSYSFHNPVPTRNELPKILNNQPTINGSSPSVFNLQKSTANDGKIQGRSNRKLGAIVIPRMNAAERKKYLRFKLRIWMLTLFFPILLFNTIKKKAKLRKEEALRQFLESKTKAEQESIEFFHTKLDSLLKKILESSNSLIVVSGKRKGYKTLSDSDIQQRMDKYVKPKTTEFLQQLIIATEGNDFKQSIWQYIGHLIVENSFLPDNYLFECEVKRLNFNTLGALKEVTPNQQNMLIGSFLLIRILINKLILSFDVHTKIKKTENTINNALALASVIYFIFDDYYKKKNKIIPHNTVHLEKEAKLKRADPIFLAPEYEQLWKLNQKRWDDESILGLWSKEELSKAMENNMKWVQEVQDKIEYWLNNIKQIVLEQIVKKEGNLVRRSSL